MYFSSAGMYKIFRPAIGETLRYRNSESSCYLSCCYACLISSQWLDVCFIIITHREMSITELKDKYRETVSLEKAHSGWKNEYEVASQQVITYD